MADPLVSRAARTAARRSIDPFVSRAARTATRRLIEILGTAADEIYKYLERDLLSGHLRPGHTVTERELVERFECSRSPVREAMHRLRDRGYLAVGFDGTMRVQGVGESDLERLHWLRLRLEALAAASTAENIEERRIDELERINALFQDAVERGELDSMLIHRRSFHLECARGSGNPWLTEILTRLRDQAREIRHDYWRDPKVPRRYLRAQTRTIAALRCRDANAYRKLVLGEMNEAWEFHRSRLALKSSGVPVVL